MDSPLSRRREETAPVRLSSAYNSSTAGPVLRVKRALSLTPGELQGLVAANDMVAGVNLYM